MLDIALAGQERAGRDEFSKFDLARYTKRTFGMFGGSEETSAHQVPQPVCGSSN